MNKPIYFLQNPEAIRTVLQTSLMSGLEEAARIGATCGAIVAAVLVEGELYLYTRAFGGDVAKENDPDKKWQDDPKIGINYVGYAIGKVMQSIRTSDSSNEGNALGYGESDSAGSHSEIYFSRNFKGEEIKFQLITAYSGMNPDQDYRIAFSTSRIVWAEMVRQKNFDGSKYTSFSCY